MHGPILKAESDLDKAGDDLDLSSGMVGHDVSHTDEDEKTLNELHKESTATHEGT